MNNNNRYSFNVGDVGIHEYTLISGKKILASVAFIQPFTFDEANFWGIF